MLSSDASVLIFGAHAADYCFRAGGTAIRYLQAGGRVKVVSATFGERGESAPRWKEPGATVESVKAIRSTEAEAAARILGVEIEFLDLDDNPLVIDQERIAALHRPAPRLQAGHHPHALDLRADEPRSPDRRGDRDPRGQVWRGRRPRWRARRCRGRRSSTSSRTS